MGLVRGSPPCAQLLQREHQLDRVEHPDDPCQPCRCQPAREPDEVARGTSTSTSRRAISRSSSAAASPRRVRGRCPSERRNGRARPIRASAASVELDDPLRPGSRARAPGRSVRSRRRARARRTARSAPPAAARAPRGPRSELTAAVRGQAGPAAHRRRRLADERGIERGVRARRAGPPRPRAPPARRAVRAERRVDLENRLVGERRELGRAQQVRGELARARRPPRPLPAAASVSGVARSSTALDAGRRRA